MAGGDGFCLQDRVGSLTGLPHFLCGELCRETARGFYSIIINATTIPPAFCLSKQATRSSWRPECLQVIDVAFLVGIEEHHVDRLLVLFDRLVRIPFNDRDHSHPGVAMDWQGVGWSNAFHPAARRIALRRTIREKARTTTAGAAAHREAARCLVVGGWWGGAGVLAVPIRSARGNQGGGFNRRGLGRSAPPYGRQTPRRSARA